MILYFLDSTKNVCGMASSDGSGIYVHTDAKEDDLKTGIQSLEFCLQYSGNHRTEAERFAALGNTVLVGGMAEAYTIVDTEQDWFGGTIMVYTESAGLNLINMELDAFQAPSSAKNFVYYFNKFFGTTEWTIGINELSNLTKKLEFDSETGTERLQKLVSAFGGEMGFSFDFEGNKVVARYVNLYKSRGTAATKYLKLGEHITKFFIKRSGTNIATAIRATGKDGLTLAGKTYDDGDLYLSDGVLYSRSALAEWGVDGAHIVRNFSFDTSSKANLLTETIRKLTEVKAPKVEYEASTAEGFMGLSIGDNVIIQDLAGKTAYQTRVINTIRHEDDNRLEVQFGDYVSLVAEDAE